MRPSPARDVGGRDGYDTTGLDNKCLAREREWTKDKKNHGKWPSEVDQTVACTAEEEHGDVEEERTRQQHLTFSDESMKAVEGSAQESADQRKVKAKARSVLDRLTGSRAQLPSGRATVVNNDNEGRALCNSALDSASFLAQDKMFSVCRCVAACVQVAVKVEVERRVVRQHTFCTSRVPTANLPHVHASFSEADVLMMSWTGGRRRIACIFHQSPMSYMRV